MKNLAKKKIFSRVDLALIISRTAPDRGKKEKVNEPEPLEDCHKAGRLSLNFSRGKGGRYVPFEAERQGRRLQGHLKLKTTLPRFRELVPVTATVS